MHLVFLPTAADNLQALPRPEALRIVKKMKWYAAKDDPLSFAKRLTESTWGTYRFRVGDYRVFCDVERGAISILLVLAVRNRQHAYRK